MIYILYILIGYLLGSIPSAVWLGKAFHDIDIREFGSKNAGATNSFRVLGKTIGTLVLLIDVLKGYIASVLPYIFIYLFEVEVENLLFIQIISSIACVLGHIFPIFAKFRGGKGVATSLGLFFGINPYTTLFVLIIFLFVFIISGYVSLGSMTAALAFPLISYLHFKQHDPMMVSMNIFFAVAIVLAHRKNINRLLKGQENKMNFLRRKA